MSKDKMNYKPVFNISVVGLSGTERFKGASGVGKSCLCNRFVRPNADDYYPEHTSALSQGEFSRRVVSNDMFLYWGEVTKMDDHGLEYNFNVVEQTEFLDDQSYQPHRSSTNYVKRCSQTKLTSLNKLMYICNDQLGVESDFEQKEMPDGKLLIDGFILCIDVSHVKNRTIDDQLKFIRTCYHYLSKTKKPIVLALTKCDERVDPFAKEAEKFASLPTGRKTKIPIPIVETSAEENINVELAFLVLAQKIDKARSKSEIISYDDASIERRIILNDATEDLSRLLSEMVKSYHENWSTARKMLEDKPAYIRCVVLLGKSYASKIFRKHVNRMRDEYRLAKQNDYLRYLPRVFCMILPDLSLLGATWQDSISIMSTKQAFNSWFITLEGNYTPWYENDHVRSLDDRRIPVELLQTADAENAYLVHQRNLAMKQHKQDMKKAFWETLKDSPQVTPGREWSDVVRYFKQYDFLLELNEIELSTVYENFQAEIKEKAKQDFQELLYERADLFISGTISRTDIHMALEVDKRYVAMDDLQKEREDILTRHISGLIYPNQDEWVTKCLKEKEQNRSKEKHPKTLPIEPNNHTVSEYFKKSLDDLIQGSNHMTPLFVEKCVQYVEQFGITVPGLYRTPANEEKRENMLRAFDQDNAIDFTSLSVSVKTVTGCLTWFFSDKNLPEPLVSFSLHEELEECMWMPDPSLRDLSVRGVLRKLPSSHYATFKYICTHLNSVCKHEEKNKMSSENLAICLLPTFFRPELDGEKRRFKRPCLKDVLRTCIEQCSFIFYNQPWCGRNSFNE